MSKKNDSKKITYSVDQSFFAIREKHKEEIPSAFQTKFNIRIQKDDLDLLDAFAKHYGQTRSSLLNQMIYKILLEELFSIPDAASRVLLAHYAEDVYESDRLCLPWSVDVLTEYLESVIGNYLNHGVPEDTLDDFRSSTFEPLHQRLKSVRNEK